MTFVFEYVEEKLNFIRWEGMLNLEGNPSDLVNKIVIGEGGQGYQNNLIPLNPT